MSHLRTALHPCSPDRGEGNSGTEIVINPRIPIHSTTNAAACLVQIYPPDAGLGWRHTLDRPLTLGRDETCDIYLTHLAVSHFHAQVVERNGSYYVADLRSTNGTFVNDTRVTLRELTDGDYLCLGTYIFRFLCGGNIEADYHEEIYRRSISDAMTGIHSKRFLFDFLERELARCARHHRPLALVLFDIDHFKAINDVHGHLAGDAVLRGLTARLSDEVRRDELFARFGGDEFTVVLPETEAAGAAQLADRLRQRVAGQPFEHDGRLLNVTISVGVTATGGGEALSVSQFLARADEKLYEAKEQGRNRIGS